MIKQNLFITLFVLSLPLFASNWSFLGTTDYFYQHINTGAIRAKKGKYSFRVKLNPKRPPASSFMLEII